MYIFVSYRSAIQAGRLRTQPFRIVNQGGGACQSSNQNNNQGDQGTNLCSICEENKVKEMTGGKYTITDGVAVGAD